MMAIAAAAMNLAVFVVSIHMVSNLRIKMPPPIGCPRSTKAISVKAFGMLSIWVNRRVKSTSNAHDINPSQS